MELFVRERCRTTCPYLFILVQALRTGANRAEEPSIVIAEDCCNVRDNRNMDTIPGGYFVFFLRPGAYQNNLVSHVYSIINV